MLAKLAKARLQSQYICKDLTHLPVKRNKAKTLHRQLQHLNYQLFNYNLSINISKFMNSKWEE